MAIIINVPGTISLEKEKDDAIKIAQEIGYPQETLDKIWTAKSTAQINSFLAEARHEWDVKQGRRYIHPELSLQIKRQMQNGEFEMEV